MGGCNAVGGQFVSMDPSAYNNINIMDIRVPDDEDLMRMEGYTDRGALLTKKIHTIKTFAAQGFSRKCGRLRAGSQSLRRGRIEALFPNAASSFFARWTTSGISP